MTKKRGPKGGTKFPRYSLKEMTDKAKQICNASHGDELNAVRVATAVFRAKNLTSVAKIKISALRQYGLITGTYAGFTPTGLCENLPLASEHQRMMLLRQAFLSCEPFRKLYENFRSSRQPKGNVGTFATTQLKVHGDNEQKFVDVFLQGLEYAQLGQQDGEEVIFFESIDTPMLEEQDKEEQDEEVAQDEDTDKQYIEAATPKSPGPKQPASVQITVDPTLDASKLEDQLEVLRKYGLI